MKLKTSFATLLVAAFVMLSNTFAQDVTTVEATSTDISDNLDLRAVASLFGEAENLEDFERRLNDPKQQISNLDLNEDGYVDYLRVIEVSKNGVYVVTIQAVIGQDLYQDVATIDVEKDDAGETRVQVVGDVYMYGPDYIIEPYYSRPPVIYVYLWGPRYDPWYSPYYWGYYPTYYDPWRPYPTYYYIEHVHVHRSVTTTYTYTTHRRSTSAVAIQQSYSRRDYQKKHPEQSFVHRNEGMKNKRDLVVKREASSPTKTQPTTDPNNRPVKQDWKPATEQTGGTTKVSVPANSGTKPKVDLSKDPTAKPGETPYTRPSSTPTTKQSGTDPYGRQTDPNAKPHFDKLQEHQRPSTRPDIRPTTPDVQQTRPSAEPTRRPAPTTRPAPAPTTAPKSEKEAPSKPQIDRNTRPATQPTTKPGTGKSPSVSPGTNKDSKNDLDTKTRKPRK